LNALFSKDEELTPMKIRDAIIRIRRDKLPEPEEIGSAGSFFKNPIIDSKKFGELSALYPSMPHYVLPHGEFKIPAAWFIDQCGWKGKEHGRAGVYAKQPLVLVNLGGASPDDITELARMVQNSVRERFGVDIYPEVNYI
jgi:UDP-N-acetylmuramate dehydrogenase